MRHLVLVTTFVVGLLVGLVVGAASVMSVLRERLEEANAVLQKEADNQYGRTMAMVGSLGTQRTATADNDGTVRIRDGPPWKPGAEVFVFPGHSGRILFLVFAPSSRTLASASAGGTVNLWDVDAGQSRGSFQIPEMPGVASEVSSMAFSPDGNKLAVAITRTGESLIRPQVILWDVRAERELLRFLGHSGCTSLAFTKEGNILALVVNDRVELFDAATGEPYRR